MRGAMSARIIPVDADTNSPPLDFVPGRSATMEALNLTLTGVAQTNIPVLIVGESGTGKDVYARRLHQLSLIAAAPFEKIACASTEDGQLREKLQNYACGANGARQPATLFLDGIQELGPTAQRYLLVLLDSAEASWNPRIVASAAAGIETDVETGHFRRELYFRLKGACLRLPPLRERKEDVPILLEYFLAKHARDLNRASLVVGQAELEALAAYDWPGNVRELENLAIEFIAVGCFRVDPKGFPGNALRRDDASGSGHPLPLKVAARRASRRTECALILEALERTHWNRKKAARELQVSYKSLLYKIKRIGMEQEDSLRWGKP